MKNSSLSILLTPIAFLLSCSSHNIPDYIDKNYQSVLIVWLAKNSDFSIATDSDCKCDDEIKTIRQGQGGAWVPVPNYHPYYAVGDFNSDKTADFAVVVKSKKDKKLLLAIFNAPFASDTTPVYLEPVYGALFYGPPRPQPYRLLAGSFFSEGVIFEPNGTSYKPDTGTDEE